MTNLTKPIKRISAETIRERGQHRPIVITLEPPNILAFRAKGCRKSYRLTAAVCYAMAVRAETEARRLDKKKARRSVRRGCL